MRSLKFYIIIILAVTISACDKKPKVIVEDTPSAMDSSARGNPMLNQSIAGMDNSVHKVTANEVLQTERYTYLNVSENGRKFWIATSKVDAIIGKAYIYQGGLMKTNFESQEYNKVFDTVYLVSNIIDEQQHPGGNIDEQGDEHNHPVDPAVGIKHTPVKDAIKISQLFSDKKKYEGQVITVQGKVTKVNNGIMGRNWIHIQDGSKKDGKDLDLTLTTLFNIPLGAEVALKGKVVLDKDFGAGYRYNIILEESELLQ